MLHYSSKQVFSALHCPLEARPRHSGSQASQKRLGKKFQLVLCVNKMQICSSGVHGRNKKIKNKVWVCDYKTVTDGSVIQAAQSALFSSSSTLQKRFIYVLPQQFSNYYFFIQRILCTFYPFIVTLNIRGGQ